MSLKIDLSSNSEALQETLEKLEQNYGTAVAGNVAANGIAELVKGHFEQLAAQRHRAAAPDNYYQDAANSTLADGSKVVISKTGIRQRLLGGTIRARRSKYLTIPLTNAAMKGPAREFVGLFFIKSKKGNKLLAYNEGGNLRPLFLLKKEVTQHPDPTVLPTENEMEAASTDALKELLPYE